MWGERPPNLPTGTWTHVFATYRNNSNTLALYLDGELEASQSFSTSGICLSDNPVIIGGNLSAVFG